jgi:hypothetical protein
MILSQMKVFIHTKTALVLTYRIQWLMVTTIQTTMLIEGAVEIVKVANLGSDLRNHLKSKLVWKAALEYVSFSTFLKLLEPDIAQAHRSLKREQGPVGITPRCRREV